MKEKPTPPADFECCESGCSPCVWDMYFDELREWKEAQKNQQEKLITVIKQPAKEV